MGRGEWQGHSIHHPALVRPLVRAIQHPLSGSGHLDTPDAGAPGYASASIESARGERSPARRHAWLWRIGGAHAAEPRCAPAEPAQVRLP